MPREIWAKSLEEMEIRDYPMPKPGEGEVLMQSDYGAVKHGTEMAGMKGYSATRGRYNADLQVFVPQGEAERRPRRIGNMIVGTVVGIGPGVTDLREQDRVLAYGTFREVHSVRADQCRRMPAGFPWQSAVCLDPADFAMGAVRDGGVRIGDAVAVFGMGAIGLMAVQVAKLSGAYPVIGVDPLPNRREAAKACGADLVFDPAACDVGIKIKEATDRRGVDVAIEYSGSVHALQAAIRCVAFGGNVVAGAFPPPYGPGLDLGAEAHLNRPNILFSRACSEPNRDHPRWDEPRIYATCWRLLTEGRLSGEAIVSPVVAFEDLVTAYPKIASDPGANIKLGVRF